MKILLLKTEFLMLKLWIFQGMHQYYLTLIKISKGISLP